MIILLAEDSQVLRREIEQAFRDIPGVEKVVLASSVAETRAVAKLQPFDLLVLDFALGDGTALELLNDPPWGPETDPPPVIILTIHASKPLFRQCFEAGASYCFDKTTDWEELLEVIASMAGGSAS